MMCTHDAIYIIYDNIQVLHESEECEGAAHGARAHPPATPKGDHAPRDGAHPGLRLLGRCGQLEEHLVRHAPALLLLQAAGGLHDQGRTLPFVSGYTVPVTVYPILSYYNLVYESSISRSSRSPTGLTTTRSPA